MGFWRRFKATGCTFRIPRLGNHEYNEFRIGVVDIDVFEPPVTATGGSLDHARCSHSNLALAR